MPRGSGKTTRYPFDGLDIVQEIEDGIVSANYVRTLNIDEPLARIKSDGSIRFYQQDALGSVMALTDENGEIKTTYSHDPFGNTSFSGEESDNPFQFAGRENDGGGHLFERNRYYSTVLQRYISQDPIGLAGGDVNLYVRVGNNPVRYRDPEGKMSAIVGGVAAVGAGGAVIGFVACMTSCMDSGADLSSCQKSDPADTAWDATFAKCAEICVKPTSLWEFFIEPIGSATKAIIEDIAH